MNKIKLQKKCITLLALMLVIGNTTMAGWGNNSIVNADAHISELVLGKDKKMSDPTDEFAPTDTIFAAVEIEDNPGTLRVKGRLHVVEIAGQRPGPIPGLEVIVTVRGNNTADFSFTKPNKGWPLGTYKFEALLLNANGEVIDSEEHEFTVH